MSITAISGDQLKALGYTNAQQVTSLAPGVSTLQPNGEANYSIGIRGVANNDFTTNTESPVAVYVDEVYISQMSGAGFLLFDTERVELLRGPQGTLFGRNATGGLVHYITVKPSQEFGGYGNFSYGSWQRFKAEGAINVPLNDTLAARLSVATHQGDGYVTNRVRPGDKLNNANEFAGRLQLLFTPNDDLSVLLNARYSQQDIRTGFFEYVSAINPDATPTPDQPNSNLDGYNDTDGDPYAGDYDFPGKNDLETYGFTGTLKYNTGIGELTSITDYQSVKRDYIEDSDSSPVNYFNFFLTTDAQQFSQELRLAGDTDKLKWVTGFYYMHLKINDSNGVYAPGWTEDLGLSEFGVNGVRNPYKTDTKTWSLFGQLAYSITDQLTLTGGFRWIEEKKKFQYRNIFALFPDTTVSGLDPAIVDVFDGVDPYASSRKDGNWSARLQLDYKPNDDLLLYASWNRGAKSGGFNAALLPTSIYVTDEFLSYDPEKLDAFEAGFKYDLFGGRAQLNASAYYYDYKNYQAFSIIGLDTFTLNAQAKNKGFEVEFQGNITDGLDAKIGVGYVDAKVKDVPGITVPVETADGTVDPILPGASLTPVQTPKWTLSGLLRYEFPVGDGTVALQADAQYRSKHYFALLQTPASTNKGYAIANASVTYNAGSEDWNLRFFVDNVFDKKYVVQTFDLSGNIDNGGFFLGMIERYYGRPRTWGISLNYEF
ncbi:TonB-dependent receptor [Parapedomonas caeni]